MKKNSAIVVLVVDESGSMEGLRSDTIGSMNSFIAEQAKQAGECDVRVVAFNTTHRVIRTGPIKTIGSFTEADYRPSGGTALYDALQSQLKSLGEELAARKEKDRPDTVIFVIITDGEDNASQISATAIKDSITHQTNKYAWKFIYLGAGPEAFAQGTAMGINALSVASYQNTAKGYEHAMFSVSANVTRGRTGGDVSFSDEQRSQLTSST